MGLFFRQMSVNSWDAGEFTIQERPAGFVAVCGFQSISGNVETFQAAKDICQSHEDGYRKRVSTRFSRNLLNLAISLVCAAVSFAAPFMLDFNDTSFWASLVTGVSYVVFVVSLLACLFFLNVVAFDDYRACLWPDKC